MFCPKCGSQNSDDTKFCRGCGNDITGVLALVEGTRSHHSLALAEKHIDLLSSGVRGVIIGLGFLLLAMMGLFYTPRLMVGVLFGLPFAFYFLGTGISRLVKARALKKLRAQSVSEPAALNVGAQDYIQPPRSIYQTDDLTTTPRSVTENTTRHLKMDTDTSDRS